MSPAERAKRGELSRQWAWDNFSVEVIGKKFEEFIDSLEPTNYDFEDQKPENQKPNIGFITNALIEGCTIGPPAAIEYAVDPVEEEIIKPSPLYSLTFSLFIWISI